MRLMCTSSLSPSHTEGACEVLGLVCDYSMTWRLVILRPSPTSDALDLIGDGDVELFSSAKKISAYIYIWFTDP